MMQLHVVCQKGAMWLRSVHDLADIAVQGARACDAAAAAHLYLTRVERTGAALGAAAHLRVQGILGRCWQVCVVRCVCDYATTTATGTATLTRPTDAPDTVCLLLKASVMIMMMMIDAMALLIVLMHAALPRFASSETLTRENFVRAGAHLK